MSDIVDQINAVHRELGERRIPAGEATVMVMRRSYDAPVEDVWDACTDPERLRRWFLPVTGDLELGGEYQLQGNARGEILACEPPRLLRVSWIFGENVTEKDVSEVEVRLSPEPDGRTLLVLEHAAVVDPDFWGRFGPGAVGVGWDGALLSLGSHLSGTDFDEKTWQHTPEAKEFMTRSAEAWGAAHAAAGASPDEVSATVAATKAFYVPEPE